MSDRSVDMGFSQAHQLLSRPWEIQTHLPRPPEQDMSGASSLSSVVSGLVRAQMGTSLPASVQEDEVDRYVQELILKEAKQKAERYGSLGIQAYLPP